MKREIFSELVEGFDALAEERQGKVTLRTHKVHLNLAPLTAKEVVAIRQQLNLSRSVFAMYLRTNLRTLENWEQGRARPNAQAECPGRYIDSPGCTVSGNSGAPRCARLTNQAPTGSGRLASI